MRNRARGPVAVKHLQAEPGRHKVALNIRERVGRSARQQADGMFVTVDTAADEIVCAEIAHVHRDAGNDIGHINKGWMTVLLRNRTAREKEDRDDESRRAQRIQRAAIRPRDMNLIAIVNAATPAAT